MPDDAGDRALDPGLLERLADRGLGDGLAEVDRAAGDGPVAVVGAADQQDLACVVDDDHVDGRDEAVGLRRLGGVVVVDPLRAHQRILSDWLPLPGLPKRSLQVLEDYSGNSAARVGVIALAKRTP